MKTKTYNALTYRGPASVQEMTHCIFPFPSYLLVVSDLMLDQVINHLPISLFLYLPPSCHFSPLADLSDPQDVGEEGFLVSDDHRLLQLPAV